MGDFGDPGYDGDIGDPGSDWDPFG
jgi:hypothetical protein